MKDGEFKASSLVSFSTLSHLLSVHSWAVTFILQDLVSPLKIVVYLESSLEVFLEKIH